MALYFTEPHKDTSLLLGTVLKQLLRRRQRERHKTIGFNGKNNGLTRAL